MGNARSIAPLAGGERELQDDERQPPRLRVVSKGVCVTWQLSALFTSECERSADMHTCKSGFTVFTSVDGMTGLGSFGASGWSEDAGGDARYSILGIVRTEEGAVGTSGSCL